MGERTTHRAGPGPGDRSETARQAEMAANRVRKTFRRLAPGFARRGIGAFRLFDRDIPEIRLVVDWYEGHLVVGEYERRQTAENPGWLEAMASAVAEALGVPPERVHRRRRRTGGVADRGYGGAPEAGTDLEVREGSLRFRVRLDGRLDTGLFPDHRETRRRVAAEAAGRRFLNLFGHTGTFTCHAAAGGAVGTTTVDRSAGDLERARDNLRLNGLWNRRHELVRDDVHRFLDRSTDEGRRWDLAVVDPPSRSVGDGLRPFDVLRDHRELLRRTLALLDPGGVLYFSTNHQEFLPDLEGLPVASLAEITGETVPEDYRNRVVHRCWRMTLPAAGARTGR